MMYSPSPHTVTNRPLGPCMSDCGYRSHDPRSFTASGKRSPSCASYSAGNDLTFTVCTSLCLDQMILPLESIDATGSSRPILNITVPSSYPTETALEPLMT